MRAIKFAAANETYVSNDDWDEKENGPCCGLPVYVNGKYHTSIWKPSLKSRLRLLFGATVALTVYGSQPPVAVQVSSIKESD